MVYDQLTTISLFFNLRLQQQILAQQRAHQELLSQQQASITAQAEEQQEHARRLLDPEEEDEEGDEDYKLEEDDGDDDEDDDDDEEDEEDDDGDEGDEVSNKVGDEEDTKRSDGAVEPDGGETGETEIWDIGEDPALGRPTASRLYNASFSSSRPGSPVRSSASVTLAVQASVEGALSPSQLSLSSALPSSPQLEAGAAAERRRAGPGSERQASKTSHEKRIDADEARFGGAQHGCASASESASASAAAVHEPALILPGSPINQTPSRPRSTRVAARSPTKDAPQQPTASMAASTLFPAPLSPTLAPLSSLLRSGVAGVAASRLMSDLTAPDAISTLTLGDEDDEDDEDYSPLGADGGEGEEEEEDDEDDDDAASDDWRDQTYYWDGYLTVKPHGGGTGHLHLTGRWLGSFEGRPSDREILQSLQEFKYDGPSCRMSATSAGVLAELSGRYTGLYLMDDGSGSGLQQHSDVLDVEIYPDVDTVPDRRRGTSRQHRLGPNQFRVIGRGDGEFGAFLVTGIYNRDTGRVDMVREYIELDDERVFMSLAELKVMYAIYRYRV